MKKSIVLLYGIVNYSLGSGALVCLIAFLFNLIPPNSWLNGIDAGAGVIAPLAVLVNLGLIVLFGLQHSIMARPWFKRWIASYIPEAAERSTYLLATALAVLILCLLWQPIPQVLWQAENAVLYYSLLGVGLGGWMLVLYSTFLINHFDLFGLRQVWLYFRGREYTPLEFRTRALYRWVRHPIMTGAFIGLWFTPVMSLGHLLLAAGMSIYILIGVYHEEKDLVHAFGNRYLRYMQQTRKFFPAVSKPSGKNIQATG